MDLFKYDLICIPENFYTFMGSFVMAQFMSGKKYSLLVSELFAFIFVYRERQGILQHLCKPCFLYRRTSG